MAGHVKLRSALLNPGLGGQKLDGNGEVLLGDPALCMHLVQVLLVLGFRNRFIVQWLRFGRQCFVNAFGLKSSAAELRTRRECPRCMPAS